MEERTPQSAAEPAADIIEQLWEPHPDLDANRITYEQLRSNDEIVTLINAADAYLKVIGLTDHGFSHVDRVAGRGYRLLKALGMPQRECELAAIAGLLHDIGNVVHRINHPAHSALMCFQMLPKMGMAMDEVTTIMSAVANHDDRTGEPISNPSAALIIADKSDVLRTRVRNPRMINLDIHDRVNYAAQSSEVEFDRKNRLITLNLEIDTRISQVMEYFEIFIDRMRMCRRSAEFLNCDFRLVINQVQLL